MGDQLAAFQRELEDIYQLILNYFKSLPGFDVIKEKYQEVNDFIFAISIYGFSISTVNVFFFVRAVAVEPNSTQ